MAQGQKHTPTAETRRLVESLSACGVRFADIAGKIDITDDCLRKHYKKELDNGRVDANAAVAQTLFNAAKEGNITAAIFWLKTRAGWRETIDDLQIKKLERELQIDAEEAQPATVNIGVKDASKPSA